MRKVITTTAQTAFIMAILTMISKLIGFVREMVMANYFGTSYIIDAYAMSFTILTVLFGGVIASISTAYMPIYSKITEKEGKREGDRFTSKVITLFLIVTGIISILGIIFSNQIIDICASGFTGETAALSSYFVKILFSYVIFSSTAGILEAYLQYKGIFLSQIISGYFVSACTIVAIIISAMTSYYYLAFGVLIGHFLRLIMDMLITQKAHFHYKFDLKLNKEIKEIVSIAFPTFVGSYMLNINQFVDKTLASRLAEGSIAALNYAWLLNGMIMGVTITVLYTIIYPKLTQANSLKQYDRFNNIVTTGINIVIIIALPCSIGAMLYSSQIVQIVYERGVFEPAATAMTSSAFFFYSSGLVFMSTNELIIRVYYSMRNMKTPMIFSGIGVIINIVLNLLLVQFMAHTGLALATSIASACNTVLLLTSIKYKYPHIKIIESRKKIIKIALAGFSAVGLSFFFYRLIIFPTITAMTGLLYLSIALVMAISIYLILLKLFKIEELELLKLIIKRDK